MTRTEALDLAVRRAVRPDTLRAAKPFLDLSVEITVAMSHGNSIRAEFERIMAAEALEQ
jgi:hypothetical protein